jgi:hypothetical protein
LHAVNGKYNLQGPLVHFLLPSAALLLQTSSCELSSSYPDAVTQTVTQLKHSVALQRLLHAELNVMNLLAVQQL